MVQILDADFLAGATDYPSLPAPAYAEIAFAGRSNVGKSSLINAMLERKKLVRTSNTPGATRAINIFRVRLRPDAERPAEEAHLDLVDLPGYGYAKRSKSERRAWGTLIERFLSERPGLRAVVVIVDVRRGLEPDDVELIEYLEHVGVRAFVVATKLDKLPKNQRKLALKEREREGQELSSRKVRFFGFSAVSGDGRDKLWRSLLRAASLGAAPPASPAPEG